ncbi:hypothetical protein CEE37_12420 [candidate division LCP-89 bacterium B3_LCP]|uniref:Carbohydrate kinase PfkB domain-containing protein n=1 Tax=candidate division LCP-89 bacterium B3_LCP TaxID=2012998 RepID=A0A532UUG5_UNCL8|nr:MAG: hypothetical protein CEE37_12420 [candidate division LCP-89 bacterium B3_LCP]
MNSCCPIRTEVKQFDVVGLGLCAWDRIFLFDEYPGPNQKVETVASTGSGGGPVPNAMVVFSKLGGKSAFIGVTGDKQEGLKIRSDLIKYNVDVTHLSIQAGRRSPCAYIWVDRRNGQRTVALDPGDTDPVNAEELPEILLSSTPLLLIDGRNSEVCIRAAELCLKGDGKVILDAGSPRQGIADILKITDHAVVSSDFLRGTFPQTGNDDALKQLQMMGPSSVVVTMGEKGGLWREGKENGTYSAFKTPVLDTTGAGDAFHGAYLFGLKMGMDMVGRCRFASAAAALICRSLGGRATTPAYEEVQKLIEDQT